MRYHDVEWGRPLRGETALFELLSLEVFQSGLSWLTILRKRDAFREAFEGFDPAVVARYGDRDVARLVADAGIVRHRGKISATIANAAATRALGPGGFSSLVWRAAGPQVEIPRTLAAVPASTPASQLLSRTLKEAGFRGVGPTTAYAFMQAAGVVNDHLAECSARETTDLG